MSSSTIGILGFEVIVETLENKYHKHVVKFTQHLLKVITHQYQLQFFNNGLCSIVYSGKRTGHDQSSGVLPSHEQTHTAVVYH